MKIWKLFLLALILSGWMPTPVFSETVRRDQFDHKKWNKTEDHIPSGTIRQDEFDRNRYDTYGTDGLRKGRIQRDEFDHDKYEEDEDYYDDEE